MRAIVVTCIVAIAAGAAHAQAVDVPALIKLIDNQPADMDRAAWKDKRRDAARKLALSKDKRAVPVLMKLAENETFDIIGEIAIEGLGTVGDPAALPTLQKIVGDTSRDKGQRDLARKALAKLGASPDVPEKGTPTTTGNGLETGTGEGSTETGAGTGSAETGVGSVLGSGSTGTHLLGSRATTEIPPLPDLPDDTLAAYDRLTFAGGTASFAYDTIRKELDFNADVTGLYQKRVERQAMAWGFDVGAGVVTGLINPTGRAVSTGAQITANADGEARFYSGSAYAVGKAAAALQTDYVSDVDANNPGQDFKQTTTDADFQVAAGAGYGRVLDIGAAIRVRRLARALDAARALGKPIDAATSRKLQLTWWALRGERSAYRQLVVTIAILREAGVLLGEPDAGLTYEMLDVLRDTQLFVRPSGLDLQLAISAGYLRRPAGIVAANLEHGQVEQLLASAGYGQQLADDTLEISGTAYARLRLFAGNDMNGNPNPAPWGAGASATMTRFTYGEHGDPFGAFDLTGTVEVSSDDQMMVAKGLLVSGQLGFTLLMNQASGLRLATQVVENAGTLQLGATLQGTYGLLDGTFAR